MLQIFSKLVRFLAVNQASTSDEFLFRQSDGTVSAKPYNDVKTDFIDEAKSTTIALTGTNTNNPVTGPIEFLHGQDKTFFSEKLDGLNGPKKTSILIDQNNFKVENDITQIDTNRRVINKFDMQKDGIFIDSHYRTPIGNSLKRPIPFKSSFKYWAIPDNEQSSLDFVQKGYVDYYANSLVATEIKTGGFFQGSKPIYRLLVEAKTDITGKLEIPIEIGYLLPATSGQILVDSKQFIIPTYYDEGSKKYSASIHYNIFDKKVVVLLVSNELGSLPVDTIPVRLQLEYTKPT